MPQPPAVVAERISDGHQPGQLRAHLGWALVLGGAIAGLAERVLAGHASSVAIMQRGELGADTEITRAPWRAGRPAMRRLLPGGRARLPEYARRGVRTIRVFARSDTSQLAELVAGVDAGDLKIEAAGRRPPTDRPAIHDEAAAGRLAGQTDPHPQTLATPRPGNHASPSTGHTTHREQNLPGYGRPAAAAVNGDPRKAIFGPNTPRVLQFLTRMRKLSPAETDRVASSWNKINPMDRAMAWAHLAAAAAKEDYPVIAAASAARRAAMETARTLGRTDWAFWAAAWDAGAAITADDLPEGDYQTLTFPLHAVMPALKRGRADDWGWVPSPRVGQ